MSEDLTHEDLIDRLASKYAAPTWCFLRGVANRTGYGSMRWADGIAMGLWPSRGLEIHGFECKASRADWLRELREPAKADEIAGYCDRWWVAVSDAEMVRADELPPTWGLLIPRGPTLVQKIEAKSIPERKKIDRGFLAAVMRRIGEQKTPEALIARARADGFKAGEKEQRERFGDKRDREIEELSELKAKLAEFEKASGIRLGDRWGASGARIGEAVRAVLSGQASRERMRLEGIRREVASCLSGLDKALEGFPADGAGGTVAA